MLALARSVKSFAVVIDGTACDPRDICGVGRGLWDYIGINYSDTKAPTGLGDFMILALLPIVASQGLGLFGSCRMLSIKYPWSLERSEQH